MSNEPQTRTKTYTIQVSSQNTAWDQTASKSELVNNRYKNNEWEGTVNFNLKTGDQVRVSACALNSAVASSGSLVMEFKNKALEGRNYVGNKIMLEFGFYMSNNGKNVIPAPISVPNGVKFDGIPRPNGNLDADPNAIYTAIPAGNPTTMNPNTGTGSGGMCDRVLPHPQKFTDRGWFAGGLPVWNSLSNELQANPLLATQGNFDDAVYNLTTVGDTRSATDLAGFTAVPADGVINYTYAPEMDGIEGCLTQKGFVNNPTNESVDMRGLYYKIFNPRGAINSGHTNDTNMKYPNTPAPDSYLNPANPVSQGWSMPPSNHRWDDPTYFQPFWKSKNPKAGMNGKRYMLLRPDYQYWIKARPNQIISTQLPPQTPLRLGYDPKICESIGIRTDYLQDIDKVVGSPPPLKPITVFVLVEVDEGFIGVEELASRVTLALQGTTNVSNFNQGTNLNFTDGLNENERNNVVAPYRQSYGYDATQGTGSNSRIWDSISPIFSGNLIKIFPANFNAGFDYQRTNPLGILNIGTLNDFENVDEFWKNIYNRLGGNYGLTGLDPVTAAAIYDKDVNAFWNNQLWGGSTGVDDIYRFELLHALMTTTVWNGNDGAAPFNDSNYLRPIILNQQLDRVGFHAPWVFGVPTGRDPYYVFNKIYYNQLIFTNIEYTEENVKRLKEKVKHTEHYDGTKNNLRDQLLDKGNIYWIGDIGMTNDFKSYYKGVSPQGTLSSSGSLSNYPDWYVNPPAPCPAPLNIADNPPPYVVPTGDIPIVGWEFRDEGSWVQRFTPRWMRSDEYPDPNAKATPYGTVRGNDTYGSIIATGWGRCVDDGGIPVQTTSVCSPVSTANILTSEDNLTGSVDCGRLKLSARYESTWRDPTYRKYINIGGGSGYSGINSTWTFGDFTKSNGCVMDLNDRSRLYNEVVGDLDDSLSKKYDFGGYPYSYTDRNGTQHTLMCFMSKTISNPIAPVLVNNVPVYKPETWKIRQIQFGNYFGVSPSGMDNGRAYPMNGDKSFKNVLNRFGNDGGLSSSLTNYKELGISSFNWTNYIWCGSSNASLKYNSDTGKFEFKNFHQPLLLSPIDSLVANQGSANNNENPSVPDAGQEITNLNPQSTINSKYTTTTEFVNDSTAYPPSPGGLGLQTDPHPFRGESTNPKKSTIEINDSVAGVYLYRAYFVPEDWKPPPNVDLINYVDQSDWYTTQQNYYNITKDLIECTYDNWTEDTILARMGFNYEDLFPPFGSSSVKFNPDIVASEEAKYQNNKQKPYSGGEYITTGVNQSLNTYYDVKYDSTATEWKNEEFNGLPNFNLGLPNNQPVNISTEASALVARTAPELFDSPFYLIETDLITTDYISSGEEAPFKNISFICYKNYISNNFFYGYSSGQVYTITKDQFIGKIRITVRNVDGTPAILGDKSTVAFQIDRREPVLEPFTDVNGNPIAPIQTDSEDTILLREILKILAQGAEKVPQSTEEALSKTSLENLLKSKNIKVDPHVLSRAVQELNNVNSKVPQGKKWSSVQKIMTQTLKTTGMKKQAIQNFLTEEQVRILNLVEGDETDKKSYTDSVSSWGSTDSMSAGTIVGIEKEAVPLGAAWLQFRKMGFAEGDLPMIVQNFLEELGLNVRDITSSVQLSGRQILGELIRALVSRNLQSAGKKIKSKEGDGINVEERRAVINKALADALKKLNQVGLLNLIGTYEGETMPINITALMLEGIGKVLSDPKRRKFKPFTSLGETTVPNITRSSKADSLGLYIDDGTLMNDLIETGVRLSANIIDDPTVKITTKFINDNSFISKSEIEEGTSIIPSPYSRDVEHERYTFTPSGLTDRRGEKIVKHEGAVPPTVGESFIQVYRRGGEEGFDYGDARAERSEDYMERFERESPPDLHEEGGFEGK